MENASKALIMAGSVLIGVLILTLFVYLFRTMGEYAASAERDRAQTQIEMFNANFTKFVGETVYEDEFGNEETVAKTCTMHDVVTVANFAKQTNQALGYETEQDYSDGSSYIQVEFFVSGHRREHLESTIEDEYKELLRNQDLNYIEIRDPITNEIIRYETRKYTCELTFSSESGRVIYVKFVEHP